jgi:hypothetical protein
MRDLLSASKVGLLYTWAAGHSLEALHVLDDCTALNSKVLILRFLPGLSEIDAYPDSRVRYTLGCIGKMLWKRNPIRSRELGNSSGIDNV